MPCSRARVHPAADGSASSGQIPVQTGGLCSSKPEGTAFPGLTLVTSPSVLGELAALCLVLPPGHTMEL